MWFKRRQPKPVAPVLTRGQAFDAKPVAVVPVKRQPVGNGGLRLVVSFQPRGYQKWLLRVPENATRQIELDVAGVEVFDMCDGRTSVRQIARRFARKNKVDTHEAELAVTNFIRMLVRRGLVAIAVQKR